MMNPPQGRRQDPATSRTLTSANANRLRNMAKICQNCEAFFSIFMGSNVMTWKFSGYISVLLITVFLNHDRRMR